MLRYILQLKLLQMSLEAKLQFCKIYAKLNIMIENITTMATEWLFCTI